MKPALRARITVILVSCAILFGIAQGLREAVDATETVLLLK